MGSASARLAVGLGSYPSECHIFIFILCDLSFSATLAKNLKTQFRLGFEKILQSWFKYRHTNMKNYYTKNRINCWHSWKNTVMKTCRSKSTWMMESGGMSLRYESLWMYENSGSSTDTVAQWVDYRRYKPWACFRILACVIFFICSAWSFFLCYTGEAFDVPISNRACKHSTKLIEISTYKYEKLLC